jgi:hypothetical protein
MMAKDLDYYASLDYEIKLRKLTEDEGSGWLAEMTICVKKAEKRCFRRPQGEGVNRYV